LYEKRHLPVKEVLRLTGVPRATFFAIIHRWRKYGVMEDLPRSGRPRKTTPIEDIRIVRRTQRLPFEPPREAIKRLQLPISRNTIIRRWGEAGGWRRVARKK